MMARAKVLIMAAALLVGGATACSDLTGTNVRADGVYSLQTLNGNTLPYSYTDQNNNAITINSDTYSLDTNGNYTEFATYHINNNTQSQSESGTWTQSNNVVTFYPTQSTFTSPPFNPYSGSLSNSSTFGGTRSLTISLNGTTAIYAD